MTTYLKIKRERNIHDYSYFKGNYTFYKTRKNKIIMLHWQTACRMLRTAKAGNQPEHTMEELWDKARAEIGKDKIGNH